MSCVYCPPKSRMRTVWRKLFGPVVRGFLGDDDPVDVALAEARRAAAHEARPGAQVLDRPAAAVAHPRAEPADELVDRLRERPAVGDAPLDALGHELVLGLHVGLEEAILGARAHRAERAHAAVH